MILLSLKLLLYPECVFVRQTDETDGSPKLTEMLCGRACWGRRV